MKTTRKHAAFTLIELLVVISIIAIFAGLAMPGALRSGKQTKVANNARQIGLTLRLFAGDSVRTPLASMRLLVDTLREGRCRTEEQRREYLDLIAAHAGRVLSRDPIMATVWGCDRAVTLRSIGRFVNALRNKIEPDPAAPALHPNGAGVWLQVRGVAAPSGPTIPSPRRGRFPRGGGARRCGPRLRPRHRG